MRFKSAPCLNHAVSRWTAKLWRLCRRRHKRHTAVTRLPGTGIPYPVVASIMGWSAATAIRMEKRYGHIGNQALRAAADVLGGATLEPGSLKKSPKSLEAQNIAVQ